MAIGVPNLKMAKAPLDTGAFVFVAGYWLHV
jgi:hypothetical protein